MSKPNSAFCHILCAAFLFLVAGPLFAQSPSTPLVVFLVHGLGGDSQSFGKMPEILQAEFGSGRKLIVKKLLYDTKSSVKTHSQFVAEIAVQMADTYRENKLNPDRDPFAFVVHSQGGIIARNYLNECIHYGRCDHANQPPVPKKPVLLFTLGTPHWGSPMGNKASDGTALGKLISWGGGKMDGQYKQLSIGSTLMYNDRVTAIRLAPEWRAQNVKFFVPGMRFVSVGGNVANDLQRFSAPVREALKQMFKNDINEDDIIVPSSHANPDFHYYVEQQDGRTYKTTSQEGDVQLADETYLVRLPHTEFAANAVEKLFEGIASPRAAEHIGLEYLLRELARNWFHDEHKAAAYDAKIKKLTQDQQGDSGKVREFSSEVIISMPLGYQRKPEMPPEKLIAEHIFMNQTFGSLMNEGTIETLAVKNSLAFKPYGLNSSDFEQVNKPYFAFYHAGRFAEEDASTFGRPDKRARLCYSLVFPGFKNKSFCTTVRPGESSFAKVVLEPYQPIADAKSFATTSRRMRDGYLVVGLDKKAGEAVAVSTEGQNRVSLFTKLELQDAGVEDGVIEQLEEQCAVGQISNKVGIHRGEFFRESVGGSPLGEIETGKRVEIIGRVSDMGKGSDRYLLKAKNGFNWVNAVDVDVLDGERCSRGFLPW